MEKVRLEYDNNKYEFDVVEGSMKEKAIDISSLRAKTGLITLDPGYKNTGATKSDITYLDGDKGFLMHRGYDISDLAEKSSFIEVAYLLLYKKLPNQSELNTFNDRIKEHCFAHADFGKILGAFPSEAHPMGILSSMVGALTAFHESEKNDPNVTEENCIKLIAKLPTFASYAHRHTQGFPINYPNKEMDYTTNFLTMLFDIPNNPVEIDPLVVEAVDKLLIIHADHEQNCSTSTVRLVGSSQASMFASVASGINALWGSLHGGANQEVIEMLDKIVADGGNIQKYLDKAKDKNDPFRLMGFGHRVYKNFDPRSRIIKKYVNIVLDKMKISDPALDIAMKLEEIALKDPYFVERKLYPNVDFYSGIVYRALGIPSTMFTVMFALGRLPGWLSHWMELRNNHEPIGRPRQIYVGETLREYVPIQKR